MNENKNYTSRTEKRKIEGAMENKRLIKEQEKEKNREELKRIIFEDNQKQKKIKKREVPKEPVRKETKKMPKFVRIILSLTLVLTVAFSAYLLYDSFNQVNQVYQMINALLILITIISFLLAFKKTYFYQKTKATIFTAICLIVLIVFNGLTITNILQLPQQSAAPDFSKTSLTEALTWAEANKINYEQTYEYSDSVKKYSIITQDVKPNTLTKNIKNINFEVSNGPDYNKEVIISDMTSWDIDEVVKIIDENYLNNVTVNFENNPDVKRNTVTSQSKTGTIKRNDDVTFTVSLGDETALSPIKLKDMKNMSLFKATLYLNRNAIDYELKYEFSDKIEKGNVISSSVKKGKTISPNDKITLTISKGKEIVVPELKNKKMSEVTKWIIENNLKINYSDKYNNEIKSGRVIEATYKKGDIIEEDSTIGIIVSKGKLKMPKFNSVTEFKSWADKYEIKYEIKEEFNDIKKGDIIKFSVETNKTIDPDEGVIAYVSKGKAIEVPNFVGKTKSEITKTCNELGINCSFTNEYSTSVKEGNAISQSIKSGEKVAEGDTIRISIATKTKTTTSSSSNKGSSTPGSNTPTNTPNTSTQELKTFSNIFIQSAWVNSSSDANTNCSKIRSGIQAQTSSKVNISCTTKYSEVGRAMGKIHEDSPYQANKSYTFKEGTTYTFILVK